MRDQDDQPDAREGQAGRSGVAERPVVPLKPGNVPGEGRGLSSRQTQDVVRDLEIGQPSALNQTDGTGQRSSLAIIAWADWGQTKGLGLALCSAR